MHTWSNEVVVEWQDIDRFEATFGEICQDAGVFGPYAWLVVCSYAADTKANLIELMLHATSVDGMDAEGRNVTATLRTEKLALQIEFDARFVLFFMEEPVIFPSSGVLETGA